MMKTCCPQCETVLTLNQQQVEQRNGMVRCGVCRQVFNALEHLYEEEDDYPILNEDVIAPSPHTASVQIARPSIRHPALDRTQSIVRPVEREPSRDAFGDGVQQPTVHIHVNQAAATPAPISASAQVHERGEPSIVLDNVKAVRSERSDDYYIGQVGATKTRAEMHIDDSEDDFRVQGDNLYDEEYESPRRRSSGSGLFWFVIILLAILLLVGQLFYVFRNQIGSAFPSTRPFLMQMCGVFKCEIGIQKSVDNLALENVLISVDKTKLPKRGEHALLLQAVLVNKVEQAQEWPVLILRLKNKEGAVMNSKNIEPKEYLAPEQAMQSFPAQSRQAINLPFMLQGDTISSYELSIFYP